MRGVVSRGLCRAVLGFASAAIALPAIPAGAQAVPVVSIGDTTVTEGDAGQTSATLLVTLSEPAASTVRVSFRTPPGGHTATPGVDFIEIEPTVLTFTPGDTSEAATVQVLGDLVEEADEEVIVRLASPDGANLGDREASATIVDDDGALVELSIADATAGEATGMLAFAVSLSQPTSRVVRVDFTTSPGTADPGDDYAGGGGTVSIPAGATSETALVTVLDDALDEADETLAVTLEDPTGATLGDATAVGTIVDDDAAPVVEVGAVVAGEAEGTAEFEVTLSAASSRSVAVTYTTGDVTALAGADYVAVNGVLVVPAGSTRRTVEVTLLDDVADESDEAFTLTLLAPENATLGTATATATIVDNDPLPGLAIGDVVTTERAGAVTFTVSLFPSSGRPEPVTVGWATFDGSALAGEDYLAASGLLSFPTGTTTQTVTVQVSRDLVDEPEESFVVKLTSSALAMIADGEAVAVITDDDDEAVVSVLGHEVQEGGEGENTARFDISLAGPSGLPVTVSYATFDGTATAGLDYVPVAGLVTIPAGGIAASIRVAVLGDLIEEPDETFSVVLSAPVGAGLGSARAEAVIRDDDENPVTATAVAIVTPATGVYPLPVVFDGSASVPSDPTRRIVSWTWSFGDGATGSGAETLHAYQAAGKYDITLTVVESGPGASPVSVTTVVDVVEPGAAPFLDIAGSFAAGAVVTLHAKGIVVGTGADTFSPDQTITRAQMVVFLVRTYESVHGIYAGASGGDQFTDIAGHAQEALIRAAAGLGLTSGTSATTFSPEDPVSREQMAVFLMNLRTAIAPGAPLAPLTVTFEDIDGSFARPQIRRLAAMGVTSGIAPGLYGPKLAVTREQMAQFVVRIFESL